MAFKEALTPVCVSVVPAPVTTTVIVPVVVCGLTLLMGAVNLLPLSIVTVAVGIPLKTTLLADVDDTVVVALKPMVTTAALAPKMKLLEVADIDAVVVVMTLDPVRGPTIDTPKPGVVMVDDTTVSPVAAAAAV